MKSKILAALCLYFIGLCLSAQTKMDSLQALIRSADDDSNKVNLMLELSGLYFSTAPAKAISVAKKAESQARQINYLKGAAYALKNVGIAYYYQGNYVEALSSWNSSLAVFDSINDKVGVANILSNIGAIYYDEGEYNKALDNYLESLKFSEEAGDTLRIVTALINIGAVYTDKDNTHDKALSYLSRALELSEIIDEQNAIAVSSINIGEIFTVRNELEEALKYLQKALIAAESADGKIYTMISISKVYNQRKQYDKALDILNDALQLAEDINSRPNTSHALVAKGNVYLTLGDNSRAIVHFRSAAKLAENLYVPKDLEKIYTGLHKAYFASGQLDSAYKFQQLMVNYKDTLYNIEVDKILSKQLFNFQIEKKQNEINLLKKDQELRELEIQKQKVIRNLIMAGFFSVIIFLLVVFRQKRKITQERDRSDKLLLNILPYEIAEELKSKGKSDARDFNQVTVLFTDFVSFTQLSEKLPAKDLVSEINYYFKAFDEIISKHKIEKIKTIGDAYMAAGGLPVPNPNSTKEVIKAALEMQKIVAEKLAIDKRTKSIHFEMRIGIHTGPVVAGIVGVKKFQYDIWGDTVNTAARMESSCIKGRINISEATYELVKDDPDFKFENRGKVEAKGKGKMEMYFVEYRNPNELENPNV